MTVQVLERFGSVQVVGPPLPGHRKHGVPVGGPFDTESSRIANALLGNPLWSGVLELAMARLRLKFDQDTVVAVVGGGHTVWLDGEERSAQQSFKVSLGSELLVSPSRSGLRMYLAFPGGIQSLGGQLVSDNCRALPTKRLAEPPSSLSTGALRVIGRSIERCTVSVSQDRVGVRLHSGETSGAAQSDVSRPVVMGSVQRTPSGDLLVHGPDGPTIGGYMVEAVVVRADRDRLGQLPPGTLVEFETVLLSEAESLYQEGQLSLQRTIERVSL